MSLFDGHEEEFGVVDLIKRPDQIRPGSLGSMVQTHGSDPRINHTRRSMVLAPDPYQTWVNGSCTRFAVRSRSMNLNLTCHAHAPVRLCLGCSGLRFSDDIVFHRQATDPREADLFSGFIGPRLFPDRTIRVEWCECRPSLFGWVTAVLVLVGARTVGGMKRKKKKKRKEATMVDAVVSFALNRLTDFLIQEAAFLWLNDITKIAYDTEDVIDKFILQVRDGNIPPTGCFPSMSSCVKCRKKVNLHDIRKDIEELKIRINDLPRVRELYQLESSRIKGEGSSNNSLARLRELRRTTSFSVEKKVIGHDDGTKSLLAKLLDLDRRRFVVSIYGMGGLGKTTLAGKLYHHLEVKRKFDCRAWVCVSQDYNTHDLLLRIISSFGFTTKTTKELKRMNEEGLERYLHGSLQGRSYLLVADDIWKKEAWLSFKRAFPDCNNGSRVIITTRSQEVAEDSDQRTFVHKLRFLTFDESWQLFCEKAFGNPNANGVEEQLKTLGMEMVQKCRGLPLAVIVLGGLLSNKTQLAKWKAQEENRNMEDFAKDNFHELINRSLIQIGSVSWGRVTTCRVHDLLRELAIEKARELNMLYIYDQMKHSTGNSSVMSSCRQEALYSLKENCLWLQQSKQSLHSLLSFDTYGYKLDIMTKITAMYTEFRFLRVLKLDGYLLENYRLCEEIGMLIHLKYLGLRETYVNHLPWSTINLQRLQTLDLFSSSMEVELSNEISKLQELRHLFGKFKGNLEIGSLTKLQSLKYARNEIWISINTEKLMNLRELWIIYGSLETANKFQFDSIAKLERLEQLAVKLRGDYREDSCLKNDLMPSLEKLQSLMILFFGFRFYSGKNLFCSAQGFRWLEILKLEENDKLEEWQVEEGAMPRLRGLIIPKDSRLRILERFRSIPPLTKCTFERG
ncbi:hypothetical protein Ddye_028342 [Dipteronia dyeriana]|uniref:NB-ARC domain-containing protein n=1 Tax=Dipteronia dyeriana TaxID=168575 RepID=A0AAD9WS86_9ROSI|nr:hypothetical protein Ddye_028342 [Dipteronia dyeriana]